MHLGLIGLPRSGRTTVYNLLTGRGEETGGFGGRQAHLATIKVPDERIDRLSAIFSPKKTTYAEIAFTDFPGFEVGQGGIPAERLNEMRNVEALVHVLRGFEEESSPRAEGSTGLLADAVALEQELILTDLLLVERRLERIRAEFAKGRKELATEMALMERLAAALGDEQPLRRLEFDENEMAILSTYQLLSRPPMILLANCDDGTDAAELKELEALATENKLGYIAMNARTEWEITQLDEDDRALFLEDLGIDEPARGRFIRACYDMLSLASFFTVGEDEVRAWTIARELPAVRAAGKIHSDLERGFIRAEVIAYALFIELGTLAEARKQGALRLEGKEYPVQDGDILNIRFNV